jgi:protein-arginine kinase activator protein McsA
MTSVYQKVNTCKRCGKEYTDRNTLTSLYCSECYPIVRREQTKERVRKYREKNKLQEKDKDPDDIINKIE